MNKSHQEHNFSDKLEELRRRREAVKNTIEQAKGRAVELERRAEEQNKILSDLGVTPETAPKVLEALEQEIVYNTDLAERLLEEVENGVKEYQQAEQASTI